MIQTEVTRTRANSNSRRMDRFAADCMAESESCSALAKIMTQKESF